MGTIVEYDPSSISAAASAARGQVALSGAPVFLRDQEPQLGIIGTAYETYMQETWIGSWLRYGFTPDDQSPWNYEFNDYGFNPYSFYLNNRNDYMDIDHLVKNGEFDGVITEGQFRDRAERLRKEMEARERIANGSTIGMLAGGILAFADVSLLVPGPGWASKVATGTRVGARVANKLMNSTSLVSKVARSRPARFAGYGAYYSAVQEAGLHTMQELRTLDESAYNTGMGAVFGGALGGIAVAASKSSPLHPQNPNYVFRPDSPLTMGVRRMGDSLSESVVLQPVIRNGERAYKIVAENPTAQSLSAAARERAEIMRGRVSETASVGRKAVSAVGRAGQAAVANTVGRASPVISGLMSKSAAMREVTEGLYDLGGIMTTGHAKGQYRASVEDIAGRIEHDFNALVLVKSNEAFQNLQLRLAELGKLPSNSIVRGAQNAVGDAVDFAKEVAKAPSRSGEARQSSINESGRFHNWEFEEIVRRTAYDDMTDDVVNNLKSRFGDEGAEAIISASKPIAENLHMLNKAVEDRMVELGMITDAQRLGRDYIAPQLWDGKGVHKNRAAARAFFMEVFAGNPPEEFLRGYNLDEATFAKLGSEDVTITRNGQQEVLSPERGLEARLEILDDWSAGTQFDKIQALEANLKAAESAAATARQEAILAAREVRKNITDIKNASVDEAVAILREREVDRASAQRRVEILRLVKRRANTELALAKAEAEAREAIKPNAKRDVAGLRRTRAKEVKEAEQLLKMIEEDVDALPADISFARQNLTAADNNLWRAAEDGAAIAQARMDGQPIRTPNLARLRERLRTIERDITRGENKVKTLDAKLQPLRKAAADATATRKAAQAAKKVLRDARKDAAKGDRQAQRKVRILERQLDKAENKQTLSTYVEDLVDAMASRRSGQTPIGKLEGEVFESGRAKNRMIKLTKEQRRRAQELGLLRSDFYNSILQGVSETSKRIAFRDVFGHHGTTEQKILDGMKRSVRDDYDALISAARKAGKSDRHIRSLEKTRDRHVGYVENGVLRQLGLLGLPENSESILHYALAKAREWNFIRYGSGFLIPSLTDLSNVTMTTGFGTFSYKNLKAVNNTLKGMGNDEIRRLVYSMELLMHNSRNIKMNNGDDFRRMAGIGNYGTITHKTTATIDQVSTGLSRGTSYASGMLWWNSRLKMMAMVELQHNFTQMAGKYDELLAAASAGDRAAGLEIAKLASLGLGSDQMRNIQKMFAKHPPSETDGILELGMGRWLDEGEVGQRAYQEVLTALEHVANRAIMTPGKGDTPFFMSSEYGKTLMQFQTYGYVIMTRFMMPAFQRMATYGDMDAFLSFGLAMALGSGVVAAKDLIRDGEIKERSAAQWGYDVIDRSGFLTYLSTPSAQVMRFFDAEASRYSNERNRFALVGGPTGGLAQDLMDLGSAVGQGDMERMGKTGQKLLPFRVFAQIYNVIAGDD